MMKKSIFFVAILLIITLLVNGCKKNGQTDIPIIAVANYGAHPIIDTTINAFKERLAELGYRDKESIILLWGSVDGNLNLAPQMISGLLSRGPDVMVAITTPISQAVMKRAQGRIPLIFCGVTDPVGAGLVPSWENHPDSGVTGTSDRWPYAEQMDLIRQLLPDAKRVGIPFNSGEANSQYALEQIQALAPDKGFHVITAVATTPADVYKAVDSLVSRGAEVIYTGSDNTVMAGFQSVLKISHERKIPVIVGESATVEQGGLGTYSVNYSELGRSTADLVIRILKGEKPGEIPIVTFKGSRLILNPDAAQRMGVVLNEELLRSAEIVYTQQ
ncbi:MAG: ABC transporter substrate-binding protein [Acidobacteriota bacterium]|nr:ABC transporter substrate-binding protein [Acidobacteriota bacterium]